MSLLLSVLALSLLSLATGRPYRRASDEKDILNSCCEPLQNEDLDPTEYPSGLYTIKLGLFDRSSDAWCDMDTDNGGWTVIMRRFSDKANFKRLYHEYEEGFGDLDGEFWYGLQALQSLTGNGGYEMRVDMFNDVNSTNSTEYVTYSTFEVGRVNYTLTIGGFEGSISDSLLVFNDQEFAAKEHKDDFVPCAKVVEAGWWFEPENCVGEIGSILTRPHESLTWYDKSIGHIEFDKYEMKIRPLECNAARSSK